MAPLNVVLIEADQLSARWLGCYGNGAAHTPYIDALAADGVRFEHCYANLPVCMPSRASTMTGRSAQHHGVFFNGWELGLDLPTYPQVLRVAGVQTFGIGKFHLENHFRSAHNDVLKYGFDRAETTEDIRAGEWLDWVAAEHPEHYERALATVWDQPHLTRYGPGRVDLTPALAAARAKHPARPAAFLAYPSVVPEEACQTRWIADRAIHYVKERDRSRPFCLKVSFVDPHDPYDPPARFLDLIDPAAIPPPLASDDPALLALLPRFRRVGFAQRAADVSPEEWCTVRRYYLASLAFIDEQVGRIRAALEAEGLADSTVILFTADHGDMLGDYGLPTKGPWHFDACMRVPLLVAGPGVRAAAVEPRTVTNLDLFPTITELAGAAHDTALEGRSLVPLCRGAGTLDRPDAALVETYGSYRTLGAHVQATTVVTPHARLTRFGDGGGMLFDLDRDPQERTNLYDRSEAAGLRAELTDLMLDLVMRQYQPLPNRNRQMWVGGMQGPA